MNSLFYLIAIFPISLATVMAFGDGVHNFPIAIICLLIMSLLQAFINKTLRRVSTLKTSKAYILIYLFIFFFYGLMPVSLCYYWQSLEINLAIILSGLTPGFFAMAVFSTYQLLLAPQSDPKKTPLNRDFALRNFSRQQIIEEKVRAKSTASSNDIIKKSGGSSQISLSNEKSGLKRRIHKIIIMDTTVVGLFMPVILYLLIADHKGILICSFMIIVSIAYLFDSFIDNTRKFDDLIFFNKFLIIAYLFFFARGWIS